MTARGADLEALGELGRGVAALARSGLTVGRGCATPRNGSFVVEPGDEVIVVAESATEADIHAAFQR